MSTEKEQAPPKRSKLTPDNKLDIMSILISIVSIVISVTLLLHQITLERLPNVVCLNSDVAIHIFKDESEYELFTYSEQIISIPIHNIGVGTAQNCEITWVYESVEKAYYSLIDMLKPYVSFHEFNGNTLLHGKPYLYNYSFQYRNSKLDSIWVLNTYPEKTTDYSVDLDSMYCPYILPVTENNTKIFFYLPNPIAPMLVDLAKYEINEPLSLDLEISFQDIAGKAYSEIFRLTFTFDEFTEDIENNKNYCIYKIVSQKL